MTLQGLTPEHGSTSAADISSGRAATAGTLGRRKWLAKSNENLCFCHHFHVSSCRPWRLSIIKFSLESCPCEAKATSAQGQTSPAGTQDSWSTSMETLSTPLSLSSVVFGGLSFLCMTLLLAVTTVGVRRGEVKYLEIGWMLSHWHQRPALTTFIGSRVRPLQINPDVYNFWCLPALVMSRDRECQEMEFLLHVTVQRHGNCNKIHHKYWFYLLGRTECNTES